MVRVVRRAVKDRQRALPRTLRVPYGLQRLSITPEASAEIISQVRRRVRSHNAGRRHVEQLLFEHLASVSREETTPEVVRERTRRDPVVREALERMWPVLTPTQLLNDLFGSPGLLRSAAGSHLLEEEWRLLFRERHADAGDATFTHDDVPLLDEALELLGPRPRHKDTDSVRTYGHIVVDEAQDLTPMQLRVLDRRSLNGSMTIVGDIAQATGSWPHGDWSSVLDHLPDRRAPRRAELTVGYRVPGPIMELAARVLPLAAPGLSAPSSIRATGDRPVVAVVEPAELDAALARTVVAAREEVGSGNVGIVAPDELVGRVHTALDEAGVDHGRATRQGLEHQVTVVPVSLAKGLELDSVVVLEPRLILDGQVRGAQSLYVALTRSTKRLTVLASQGLPEMLQPTELVAD